MTETYSGHKEAAMEQARAVLRSTFGFNDFRPAQEEIIRHLVNGGEALVLMPTGGGKSLCYQIPALVREGTGVVVSPLIALMQDQVDALRQVGVRAAYLNSTLDASTARATEQALLAGELDLLYVAPERLMTERMLELLARSRLALFAIDEAHCVSQWGHNFRPEYLKLSALHERFPEVPRVALTATADAPTRKEIAERLGLVQARRFISGFDRPNIRYRVTQKHSGTRNELLCFIRDHHDGEAGIVYCLSRKKVDSTADWLRERGLTALPYHAGLTKDERQDHQTRFLREDGVVMVATIAFGMGIDKPDVRFVAHLDLPKSLEAYYQETGRAGRDGLPADAWMAYGLQDVIMLRQMLESGEASEDFKRIERARLEAMLAYCELTTCRRQRLLAYFGEALPEPCGNCDICLEPPETWDATLAAQKALSCVHRTGQRFGVNHVLAVLLGKDSERIRSLGHDRLSTYGIGTELDATGWRAVFRQLVAVGMLTVDAEGFGALKLTDACRPVLRGERRIWLRKDARPARRTRRRERTEARGEAPGDTAHDPALFEALRGLRRRLADAQGVPAYIIFNDATLREMAAARPRSLDELAQISGVGERKLTSYGNDFLDLIRDHLRGPAGETAAPGTQTT
ncbi:DNA helicase RecQ [Thioalkalivibrio denitrificans]|uniref:DNA helicase RecQ n=1 Tax=Thioalkalivibrio denitrificans TaxID=108003 RepID=A0A1V3NUX9_9GAMM|nr:DNA helicase RecQ [Thioalkalivibrio denitrificans]OOG28678.1 DNA helicase RecQ [Thioalkalivibrio denitrificans]